MPEISTLPGFITPAGSSADFSAPITASSGAGPRRDAMLGGKGRGRCRRHRVVKGAVDRGMPACLLGGHRQADMQVAIAQMAKDE